MAGVFLHGGLACGVIGLIGGGSAVHLMKGPFAQDRDEVDVLGQCRPFVQVEVGVAPADFVEALVESTGLLQEARG